MTHWMPGWSWELADELATPEGGNCYSLLHDGDEIGQLGVSPEALKLRREGEPWWEWRTVGWWDGDEHLGLGLLVGPAQLAAWLEVEPSVVYLLHGLVLPEIDESGLPRPLPPLPLESPEDASKEVA